MFFKNNKKFVYTVFFILLFSEVSQAFLIKKDLTMHDIVHFKYDGVRLDLFSGSHYNYLIKMMKEGFEKNKSYFEHLSITEPKDLTFDEIVENLQNSFFNNQSHCIAESTEKKSFDALYYAITLKEEKHPIGDLQIYDDGSGKTNLEVCIADTTLLEHKYEKLAIQAAINFIKQYTEIKDIYWMIFDNNDRAITIAKSLGFILSDEKVNESFENAIKNQDRKLTMYSLNIEDKKDTE